MVDEPTGNSADDDSDIEITSTPGIADYAASGAAPPGEAISQFRDTVGVAGTEVGRDFDEAREIASTAEGRGWGWLPKWFSPTEHVRTGSEDAVIETQAYWLTLPNCPGASVKLTVSSEHATETSATCTILGIGGGPTFTVTNKIAPGYTATQNRRASRTVIGHFARIEVRKRGQVLGTYARLVGIDKSGKSWAYPNAQPPPADPAWQLEDEDSYDWSDAASPNPVTVSVERDTTWEFNGKLKLSQLNLEAGLSRKVTYKDSTTLEYMLPPGHVYAWRRYQEMPVFYWTP